MKNKAIFLDRDGTINVDTGYVGKKEKLVLLEGAALAIKNAREAGYLAIVITNQSGIARGYFSMSDVVEVNNYLNVLLCDYGTKIDAFYVCPHHPEGIIEPYNIKCNCRKPELELYNKAIRDYNLEPGLCAAIGDKLSDIERLDEIGILKKGLISKTALPYSYNSLYDFVIRLLSE